MSTARQRAFAAHGTACQDCGGESSVANPIEVHHVDRNRRNNDPQNLRVLCRACHVARHVRIRREAEQAASDADFAAIMHFIETDPTVVAGLAAARAETERLVAEVRKKLGVQFEPTLAVLIGEDRDQEAA